MPRDTDKDNARGRRDRPPGGKRRSGAARGPEKKLAKRGFPARDEGSKRPSTGKRAGANKAAGAKPYARTSRAGAGKPYAGKRDGGDAARPRFKRDDGGDKRAYAPRGDSPRGERPSFKRDDRAPRADRGDARPAGAL
jgi:23S rRNA pseudouridine2605 synthase